MGRPQEAAKLLQAGLTPSGIARRFNITVGSVEQYLWRAIGEGLILRSDVLFSFPKKLRQAAEKIAHSKVGADLSTLCRHLGRHHIKYDRNELRILWKLTTTRVGHGDLYEFITGTEKWLHDEIRRTLVASFGEAETQWWRQGIPKAVRASCAAAREEDAQGDAEAYAYTTLIHLREILDRQWLLFVNRLPKDVAKDKKAFLRELEVLNGIRNRVMHPTRLHKISDEDFEFARELHRKIRIARPLSARRDVVENVPEPPRLMP